MTKNIMVCNNSSKCLHRLNESAGGQKYILTGVFAELDTLNRNGRIYTKDEYLKHLAYLREDIRKGEPLLGELDHPDDRFEVKLKEASHRVLDLWYDANQNVVMGKIELLNTPNGKLAQSIVDQGIPLHISSRAAGTVNSDNTVSIQQIYTYDLVCKPGFAGAVLHRVNESVGNKYSDNILGFLKKNENAEHINMASAFGLLNESVGIFEMEKTPVLRKEAEEINENDNFENIMKKVYSKLYEDDEQEVVKNDEKTDDEKEKDTENTENDDNGSDDEKEDDGIKIVSTTAEYADDTDSESSDTESEENSDDTENTEDNDEKKSDECKRSPKADPEKNGLFDEKGVTKKEEETREKLLDKIQDVIDNLKQKKECTECDGNDCKDNTCESLIMAQYPVSMCLDESNFAQFAALSEGQKTKVMAFLQDRGISEPHMINEMWKQGINYTVTEPVWLKYAPKNYKSLYNNAPQYIQESLKNTAEYLVFESQRDVNMFWENSGLVEQAETHRQNMSFIDNLPKINESVSNRQNGGMPYSSDFINAIAEMACEYNR